MADHELSHPANDYQDEISITDLLRKLWQRRGLLVALPAFFLLLGVIYVFFSMAKAEPPVVYFVKLQGIEKSHYPNGTRFSPQDLRSPEVLEQAVKTLNLPVDKKLREAVQVEYGMPTTVGIQKKYQKKLSSKKLTTTDINQINKEYLDELSRISERGLKIVVNYTLLGLTADQGAVLATAIPRAWTEIYTKKYRVFVDTRLDNVSVVTNENQLDTTSDILIARDTLQRINRGLVTLNEDARLKSLVSASGFNSSDLLSMLKRFKDVYFRVIFDAIFMNPDSVAASFITETKLKIAEINRNIEELNLSLKDISNFSPRSAERIISKQTGESIQFGENSLDQVIKLANQASLSEYLQKIISERRKLVEQRSALQTDLDRSRIEFTTQRDIPLWEQARRDYSSLVKEYVSLLNIARETSRRNYGDFYQPLTSPDVVASTLPPKAFIIVALSLFLGIFFALALALIWPGRQQNS